MPLSVKQRLKISLARVNEHLAAFLTVDFPFARKMIRHVLQTSGKQLRSRVTLLAALSKGPITTQVERLAAAIELFHQATLIHDDVIDHAHTRRRRSTLNQRYGNEAAVMLGDYLFTKTMHIMIHDLPARVQTISAQTITQVCLGEIEEIGMRHNTRLSWEDYEKIIHLKTACLFSAASECGALLAGHTPAMQRRFAAYGQALGMAFQIQDDWLDLLGSSQKLGKQPGIDLHEGHITLPVILAIKALPPKERNRFQRLLQQPDTTREMILPWLEKTQALQASRRIGEDYIRLAEKALAPLAPGPVKTELLNLAHFSIDREH